jgi:septum formation protein
MHRPATAPVILASSSPFRRALLGRLGIDFKAVSPEVDESPRAGERPETLALRLAEAKARALVPAFPDALLIGSDQVAVLGARILGKPGGHEAAVEQLLASSGRTLRFLTAVCLLDARSGRLHSDLVPTAVTLRTLDRRTAEAYVRRERPYGCAGAFMAEGLGIVLLEKVVSADPSALIGLPLIALSRMLREEGFEILSD